MSVGATTYSVTYTIADVRRVFDQFAADYDMAAQSTGLVSDDHVTKVVHDVKALAEAGHLWRVDMVLRDSSGETARAQRYDVSTEASLWSAERPGNSLWPRIVYGNLRIVIFFTQRWRDLSDVARALFQRNLHLGWSDTDIDTAYPGLIGRADRRYVSNAYGLERTTYTR